MIATAVLEAVPGHSQANMVLSDFSNSAMALSIQMKEQMKVQNWPYRTCKCLFNLVFFSQSKISVWRGSFEWHSFVNPSMRTTEVKHTWANAEVCH